jgi:hypothetical protein
MSETETNYPGENTMTKKWDSYYGFDGKPETGTVFTVVKGWLGRGTDRELTVGQTLYTWDGKPVVVVGPSKTNNWIRVKVGLNKNGRYQDFDQSQLKDECPR